MAVICPSCHTKGRRVEMKSAFARTEHRVVEVPCDFYPDGTVVSQARRSAEAVVYRYDCPACGLTMESTPRPQPVDVPESP